MKKSCLTKGWQLEGVAILVVAIAFAGCAASPLPGASIAQNQGSGDPSHPIFDASGVWEGYLFANCTQFNPLAFNDRCNAMNKIAITMVQNQLQISGFYKCRVGNMDCLNQNDSGTISHGSIENGLVALRIGMPDGSSCIFNGKPTGANLLRATTPATRVAGLSSTAGSKSRADTESDPASAP